MTKVPGAFWVCREGVVAVLVEVAMAKHVEATLILPDTGVFYESGPVIDVPQRRVAPPRPESMHD